VDWRASGRPLGVVCRKAMQALRVPTIWRTAAGLQWHRALVPAAHPCALLQAHAPVVVNATCEHALVAAAGASQW